MIDEANDIEIVESLNIIAGRVLNDTAVSTGKLSIHSYDRIGEGGYYFNIKYTNRDNIFHIGTLWANNEARGTSRTVWKLFLSGREAINIAQSIGRLLEAEGIQLKVELVQEEVSYTPIRKGDKNTKVIPNNIASIFTTEINPNSPNHDNEANKLKVQGAIKPRQEIAKVGQQGVIR